MAELPAPVPATNDRISDEKRRLIIEAFERGERMADICSWYHVKRGTAYKIVTAGRDFKLPRGGARRVVVTNDVKDRLASFVDENPFITLKELRRRVMQDFNLQGVDESTISRALCGQLFTLKCATRGSDIPQARNSDENIAARQEYGHWFTGLDEECSLVFVDECGYNIWTRRTQGRSRRGQRVTRVVHTQRSQGVNVVLATSDEFGLVSYDIFSGTMNRGNFELFLQDVCQRMMQLVGNGRSCIIVMDGARFHQNIQLPQHFAERISLRILPPYSPFLNPVELAHNAFKAAVKAALATPALVHELATPPPGMTLQDWRIMVLVRIGADSLQVITQQKCAAWYRPMLRYIPQCIAGVPIVD